MSFTNVLLVVSQPSTRIHMVTDTTAACTDTRAQTFYNIIHIGSKNVYEFFPFFFFFYKRVRVVIIMYVIRNKCVSGPDAVCISRSIIIYISVRPYTQQILYSYVRTNTHVHAHILIHVISG